MYETFWDYSFDKLACIFFKWTKNFQLTYTESENWIMKSSKMLDCLTSTKNFETNFKSYFYDWPHKNKITVKSLNSDTETLFYKVQKGWETFLCKKYFTVIWLWMLGSCHCKSITQWSFLCLVTQTIVLNTAVCFL